LSSLRKYNAVILFPAKVSSICLDQSVNDVLHYQNAPQRIICHPYANYQLKFVYIFISRVETRNFSTRPYHN
jgi:hypothetical protein